MELQYGVVIVAGVEVVEIQTVHAIKLFARVLIAVGRRKDIAEIATCRVRHIGISREANERRDNQRYDMSKVHIHLTKLMLYLKYDCFVLLANVHTPSELTKFYRQIQPTQIKQASAKLIKMTEESTLWIIKI